MRLLPDREKAINKTINTFTGSLFSPIPSVTPRIGADGFGLRPRVFPIQIHHPPVMK